MRPLKVASDSNLTKLYLPQVPPDKLKVALTRHRAGNQTSADTALDGRHHADMVQQQRQTEHKPLMAGRAESYMVKVPGMFPVWPAFW